MKTNQAVKVVGAILAAVALAGSGYWLGLSRRPTDHSVLQSQSTDGTPEAQAHAGHGSASGEINVPADRQQLVGIRTTVAELRPLTKKLRTVGIVTYDETRVAQVFAKVDGWIDKLLVNYTGTLVRKNQPLFTLYSPDLVATQDEYLLALQAKERLASSSLAEIRAGSSTLVDAARRRLSLWDISDEQIDELQNTRQPKKSLTIFSPMNGFVIKKDAFQGMKVMPDKELYTIADLSTVWVNADVYEFELASIRVGQRASITLSYFPGRVFNGKVAWISPVMDEKTRTAKVRLEFANPEFALKPEMYTNVEIGIDAGKKLAVPDEAVLDSGLRKVVFLDKGDGRFAPAEVKLGSKYDSYYEVLEGLSAGEKILASAAFLLDSESRLSEAMGAMAGMPGMDMADMPAQTAAAQAPAEKKVGDLIVALETQPAKPQLGANLVRIKVKDAKGNPVGDATVNITAIMNMPGMAPGKAKAKHVADGVYEASINLTMAGGWNINVSVERPGQKPVQEKFTVTVR